MRSAVGRLKYLDSGLVVVLVIIITMVLILIYCLLLVKYEWCHVLYANNTVSVFINKSVLYSKLRVTSDLRET